MTTVLASHRASRVLLAVRVAAWLSWLPVRWHRRSLTSLLDRIPPARPRECRPAPDLEPIVRVVLRVCRLPLFALPIFPRVCLREALALYHVLGRIGHPVSFCVSVRKDGRTLVAHSWVALDGRAIVPWSAESSFTTVYSYPRAASASSASIT